MEPQSPQEARKYAVTVLLLEEAQERGQVVPIHTAQLALSRRKFLERLPATRAGGVPSFTPALGSIVDIPVKMPSWSALGARCHTESTLKMFF